MSAGVKYAADTSMPPTPPPITSSMDRMVKKLSDADLFFKV
jgi:hypothetical protein